MATTTNKRRRTTRSTKSKKTTSRKRRSTKKTDPKYKQMLGFALVCIAIFLIVSFISYFFTWRNDHDVISLSITEILSGNHDSKNLLGTAGAFIAQIFVFRLFGIASLILAAYIALCGVDLMSKKYNYNLKDWGINAVVATVFSSIVIGFLASASLNPWAGVFGMKINAWLNGFIGWYGTLLFLFLVVGTLIISFFNLNIDPVLTFFKEMRLPDFNNLALPTLSMSSSAASSKTKSRAKKTTTKRKKKPSDVLAENVYEIENIDYDEDEIMIEPEVAGEEIDIQIGSYGEDQLPLPAPDPTFDPAADLEVEVLDTPPELETPFNPTEDRLRVSEQNELPIAVGDYDPTLDLANYKKPTIDLLEAYSNDKVGLNKQELQANTKRIIETLKNFGIEIVKISAKFGPTITLFELVPAPGVRISRIRNLEDDIALSLSALGIRIIAPIPGKGTIGIEVPNETKDIVSLRSIINTEAFRDSNMELPIALGTSISMGNYIADLTKMPHLLMAGATGQGKSVGINTILVSLLYAKHPAELKFILIDPKKVELSIYNKIEKHFLAKLPSEEDSIITDTSKSIHTLNALCVEMDNRYNLLKDAHVRNIKEYNAKFKARRLNPEKGHRFLPYLVLVIDEFADLIMTAGKEVEMPLTRLAQLARAVGVHLIISTQRPTVNIITGTIKANFPVRIAFRVMSKVDSKTIIDKSGADQLIGRGDMLLVTGADTFRLQCAFVDTPEVDRITDFIGNQPAYASAFELPEVADGETGAMNVKMMEKDALFEDAARLIVGSQQGSTSMIQRKMKLGYNRAGRIMDQLEAAGIVGPSAGSKPREVLMLDLMSLEDYLSQIRN